MNVDKSRVLSKAIKKAFDNGWQLPFEEPVLGFKVTQDDVEGTYQAEPYIRFELDGDHDWCVGLEKIIYDKEFAKALWGGKILTKDEYAELEYPRSIYEWKHRLMQMVIADDPIAYLGNNLT